MLDSFFCLISCVAFERQVEALLLRHQAGRENYFSISLDLGHNRAFWVVLIWFHWRFVSACLGFMRLFLWLFSRLLELDFKLRFIPV